MYKRIDGGRLIGRTLAQAGTTHLFCLHGGHIDPILYGCANEGIRIVDCRHEAAAVHMAEAWSLATGKTGVCAITAGPGVANGITGLANAHVSGSPLLCLAGKSPRSQNDTATLQDMDQLPLVGPVTKWARTCHEGKRAGEYVMRALAESRAGRPGPAFLEIPLDVLSKPVGDDALKSVAEFVPPAPPGADPHVVDQVRELLEAAERPIVIAGSGAFWSGAGPALTRLAERAGVPVFTVNAGRGVVPDDHPWAAGHLGPVGGAFTEALKADLVICLGVRLGFPLLGGKIFMGKKLVRVDRDAGETVRNRSGEINVVADIRVFAEQLAEGFPGPSAAERERWRKSVQDAAQTARNFLFNQKAKGIHPGPLMKAITDAAGKDATLVADGGDIVAWSMCGFPAKGPGRLLTTSPYFGCLGVGIPFALASKLARPDRPVFLLEGDGSFGFNAMEFDTAIRHKIPFVCFVANNRCWGMSRHGQGLQFGYDQPVATELGDRPYHEIVKAMGGHGELVTDLSQMPHAIDRALSSDLPACLNVITDPAVFSPATALLAAGGDV